MVMGAVRDHAAATHRDLLVGVDLSDDAGVYDLGDGKPQRDVKISGKGLDKSAVMETLRKAGFTGKID